MDEDGVHTIVRGERDREVDLAPMWANPMR
jgi:hypothetical protein